MFDTAGIFFCKFGISPYFAERRRENLMSFIDAFRFFSACIRKFYIACCYIDGDVAFLFQEIDTARNAGFYIAEFIAHVHRTDICLFAVKQQDCFKIHFF